MGMNKRIRNDLIFAPAIFERDTAAIPVPLETQLDAKEYQMDVGGSALYDAIGGLSENQEASVDCQIKCNSVEEKI